MYRTLFKIPRMILMLGLILTFGFAVTSILSYTASKRYVEDSAINQTLPLISDNIFSAIEKEILSPVNISSLMAHDSFLINWVEEGETDLAAITTYLSSIKHEYGYFSTFFISEITGNYYYYDGILKQISPEDDHDVWYYNFKAMNTPTDLDVDSNQAADNVLTVFINHRLENPAGEFLGVTGVGLELTEVGNTLAGFEERFNHKIFMVDPDGFIQLHSDPSLIQALNINELEGIAEIIPELLASDEGTTFFQYDDDEGTKTISSRYLEDFDWFLIVEEDQEAELLQARISLWQNLIIGFGVTLLTSVLAVLVINRYNQRLIYLAAHDELTGLYNRRAFQDAMTREMGVAQRYEQPISLLMVDVDNFKSVNDNFGHMIGDWMIREIAQTLKNTLRDIDIVGRWGGEEFTALLPNTGKAAALQAADRLRIAIEELVLETSGGEISRTVSIGVASQEKADPDPLILVQQADVALGRAKQKGKNQTEAY